MQNRCPNSIHILLLTVQSRFFFPLHHQTKGKEKIWTVFNVKIYAYRHLMYHPLVKEAIYIMMLLPMKLTPYQQSSPVRSRMCLWPILKYYKVHPIVSFLLTSAKIGLLDTWRTLSFLSLAIMINWGAQNSCCDTHTSETIYCNICKFSFLAEGSITIREITRWNSLRSLL